MIVDKYATQALYQSLEAYVGERITPQGLKQAHFSLNI
jgi:hypothetical protein